MSEFGENHWWGIELYSAVVPYDTLSWLDDDYHLSAESCYELSEDLVQIEFQNKKLLLDVGWYNPSETRQGFFRIELIHDMDWTRPLFKKNFRKINTLKQQIAALIKAIEQDQYP